MTEADYNNRMERLQRFIPFLENMIEQLKDPKMKNREQQLKKMESLYGMITDKKKKLKIETLIKCEEVIVKLYQKVKGEHAHLPSLNIKADERKSVDIYSMAGESLNRSKSSNQLNPPNKSDIPKSFFLRKPPISYEDLEVLEKDVASELERKMSLQELNSLRKELCQQLQENDNQKINTTVRNKPVLTRLNSAIPEKNKKQQIKCITEPKNVTNDKKNEIPSTSKKIDDVKYPKTVTPKVLKESVDIFGNAFSEIDKSYEIEAKKREERRGSNSKEKKDKEEIIAEKIAHVRQLAEKAFELRTKKSITTDSEVPSTSKELDKIKGVSASDLVFSEKSVLIKEMADSKSSGNVISEKDVSDLSDQVNKIKETLNKNERTHLNTSENIGTVDKTESVKEGDHCTDKKNNDHKNDCSDQKFDYKKNHKSNFKKEEKPKENYKKHNDKNKGSVKEIEKINKGNKIITKNEGNIELKSTEIIETKAETLTSETENKLDKKSTECILDKPQEIQKEIRPVNRDPRLKYGATATTSKFIPPQNRENINRLAYKYNPKPKRLDNELDVEKNVVDSIEKSMKESIVPLPPKARLQAPPPPPDDLFSPQSPDELDKAPVPAILNDILLNPKTTGVINEVVSALQRSNVQKNFLPLVSSGKIFNHEVDSMGLSNQANAVVEKQTLFSQFRQTANRDFSPPLQKFSSPTMDCQGFLQPKPVPLPLMNNSQPRGFNPFTTTVDQNDVCDEMPVLDFQPNSIVNPPHLTPYEDRIGQSGFHLDRGLNFVPPSPSYVPPSPSYSAPSNFIPPSPSYIPPSPIYDGNNDNFRDLHSNNYHNFPSERSGHLHGFFDKDRVRSQGLLGDFPQMPYNSQYGNQNFDGYYNNQTNFMETRKSFYGSTIRDPRINMNRGNQFHSNEPRVGRDNRMTYREYKEQKERENRERESRERENRERENRERELIDRQRKDKEDPLLREKEDKGLTSRHREENDKVSRENDKDRNEWDRNRRRDRSRDRYSRKRSSSRYRRDQDNRRDRSSERVRLSGSRFDKVYSSRDIDKDDFTSPLDSLYTSSKAKTGKGYGIQFKIPKLVKEEEKQKKGDKKLEKEKEQSGDDFLEEEKIENETSHQIEGKEEISSLEAQGEEIIETKVSKSIENDSLEKADCNLNIENINDGKSNIESINENLIEVKKEFPINEITHTSEKDNTQASVVDVENTETDTDKRNDNKTLECNPKKEEEESILSKFFQNLMKSSNKDEKKGALLSLISTFSDSFSDQQLKRITNIIKSEESADDETMDKTEKNQNSDLGGIAEHVDETPSESSTEKKEKEESNVNEDECVEDDPVQVSVGERIKNRKRAETVKTDVKAKIRSKTELDRLHEDIREMFIRDGVVTATGKRMCRILKDNITESDRIVEQNVPEELKKKATISRKKGRKAVSKKNSNVEMRELSVIIPKMSFNELKETGDANDKRYSLRKPVKTTNYNEIDVEEVKGKDFKKSEGTDEMNESSDDLVEEELKDGNDVHDSVLGPKKFKPKKKIRKSWAAGVIRKKGGGKTKKAKSPNADDSNLIIPKKVELGKKMLHEEEPLYLHDKDYYYKPDMTPLSCKVCDVSTKWIAAHYRSEHPDIEVLSSRLPPDIAQIAIEDAIVNNEAYAVDNEFSNVKHHYTCRFCDYSQKTLPRMYRDHVSIHTGEFRHRCPYCNYRRSHIKSMQTHVNEVHANEVDKLKRRIISQPAVNNRNIYAYICEECNYTQMSLQNIQHHVKIYHSKNTKKCKIHKIKMNYHNNKAKVDITSKVVHDSIDTSHITERSSTRSAKISAKNSDLDEENTTDMDLEEGSEIANNDDEEYKSLNIVQAKQKMEPLSVDEDTECAILDSESHSVDESVERRSKKRKKYFAKPGPAKKRGQKRTIRSTMSSTDTETESDVTRSSPRKRNERNKSEEIIRKKIDEAVFTCNTDLQEENKQIEEERLRKMQDINSTIKLRTSLEFVEKLSNRLKQEEGVVIKTEPFDMDEDARLSTVAPNELPVYEKSVLQKREPEQTVAKHEVSQEISRDVEKVNTIINGVIEKLRGVLNNTAPSDEINDLPPPMKHMDRVERKFDRELNSVVLNIGPIKVLKTENTFIYTCCSPPCIFSSRDEKVFENHCRTEHYWNENSEKFPKCAECDAEIECAENNSLLVSALDHARKSHSEFLGIKIGSIRVSSNLFPETKKEVYDDCEVPSEPKIPMANTSSLNIQVSSNDPIICTETMPQNFEDENPFSFKIVDVVSLAEDEVPPLSIIDNQIKSGNIDNELIIPETNMAPMLSTKQSTENMVSPTSLTVSNHPKKSSTAMKKFLSTPNDLFKCPEFLCHFTTNKKKMFDIHIRMHQNQTAKLYSCLYCDKFLVLEAMGDHYEQVHGMCRFACYYCLYRCIAKDYMDIHQLLVHSDLPPRMRVLPYRDVAEKNVISILSEAAKSTPVSSYICCDEDFVYYDYFVSHLENCSKTPRYVCQFKKEDSEICGKCHSSSEELVEHWGFEHGVYPLQCGYCDVGYFGLSEMMIHLVLVHPTLPPDVIDRSVVPKHKNKSCPSRAQCNFKQLVTDLRSESSKFKTSSSSGSVLVSSPTSSLNYRQKTLKNFVHPSNKQSVITKALTSFSKVTPINIMPATTSTIVFKTSTPNVISNGGLVYCLTPTSATQNQVVKAIVVNKDSSTNIPSNVRLLSPVSLPSSDPKFQRIKNMPKMIPVTSKMPKLAPLAPRVMSASIVQPVTLTPATESIPSKEEHVSHTESSEDISKSTDKLTLVEGADNNLTSDSTDLPIFEEHMMVINDDFEDKNLEEAVDPLSLDMEDTLAVTKETQCYLGATPLHEYDSDSKDTDQHESSLMRKTGLVGYQLYRCAKCNLSFAEHSDFKEHLMNSVKCKFILPLNRPYKCAHCGRFLKHYSNLLDHLWYHGPDRFQCSICNKKYPHSNQAKQHMKSKHNLVGVVMKPLIQNKRNLNVDEFVMKPTGCDKVKTPIQEVIGEVDIPKTSETKTIFFSHEADNIPQKSILSYDITCGHCMKFKNKVRSNIVRHLLLHENDKEFTVPDTAPINPVPCLEKNEKMFDKMYNLASSSHAGGRMGGQQKGDTKKTDKVREVDYPAFVPTNKRFQCCAVGCNYLCLEEANLRHHLTALHMEDLNFVCVHCKTDLSDAADVDTILKHLKLHELHLYKCSACKFMHNLRHKVERHIGEKHKNKDCTVVVLRAMDSEPFDESQQVLAPFPVAMNQKTMKLWRCCMCKYRCYTQAEAELHAKNKHDIDCRYKCALCTFKSNVTSEFSEHFKTDHSDNNVDIILAYHKDDDPNETGSEVDQFDTTPLWLRDKPRVRHIRGILFDDNLPTKKKSTNTKTQVSDNQALNSFTCSPSLKKRKRSSSAITESYMYNEDTDDVELKKESNAVASKTVLPVAKSEEEVIIIDDDDEDTLEQQLNLKKPADHFQPELIGERLLLDDVDLLCTFGDVGIPVNKNFKCPKCDYKTTKMKDFVQHVVKEIRYPRFKCSLCDEKFITLDAAKTHSVIRHDGLMKENIPLPVDPSLKRWLTIVLEKQSCIIRNLGFQTEDLPNDVGEFLINTDGTISNTSQQNSSPTRIICRECGLWLSNVQDMNRHYKFNHPHIEVDQLDFANAIPSTSNHTMGKNEDFENTRESKKPKLLVKNTLIAKDKYACSLCDREFDSVPEMEFHGKEYHDGEVTYEVHTTEMPMSYEYGRNIYRCRYCTVTGTKLSLQIHSSQMHPLQKPSLYRFSCGVCPAKFEVLKNLKQHFKSHELSEISYFNVHGNKVILKPRSVSNVKIKLYKCPVCPYISHSTNVANIKTHLKIHARPFQCGLCLSQFKSRPDARAHHLKEHPHNVETITQRSDMIEKINILLKEVLQNVQMAPESSKTVAIENVEAIGPTEEMLIEVEPDLVVDVVGDASEEDHDELLPPKTKNFARKSTGRPAINRETEEYYSFYGQLPEPVDMKKIVTTYEIADAKMRMTCDQWSRIHGLKPRLVLKDCTSLIIEDDEFSS